MNKQEIYQFLDEKGIAYTAMDHPPAYTVEDILSFNLPHPEYGAKNLFLRDDKKKNYYLLTVKDDRPVNLKDFQRLAGTRRLSFASEEDLAAILHLTRGAVTPFGILNDSENRAIFYLDDTFQTSPISVHPNDNAATVTLSALDLVQILQEHGSEVHWIHLESEA